MSPTSASFSLFSGIFSVALVSGSVFLFRSSSAAAVGVKDGGAGVFEAGADEGDGADSGSVIAVCGGGVAIGLSGAKEVITDAAAGGTGKGTAFTFASLSGSS